MAEIIRAETLGNVGVGVEESTDIINAIVSSINDNLEKHNTVGRNLVSFDLPINFGIPTDDTPIKRSNRQILVYGTIIQKLQFAGYEVKISLSDQVNTLYIAWESQYDNKYFNKCIKLVTSSKIDPTTDVAQLLKKKQSHLGK